MIVFSALVPHCPLLISAVGKERREQLKKTIQAYATLQKAMLTAKPETIVLFTPHAPIYPRVFPLFIMPTYRAHFQEFGDFTTTLEVASDLEIISILRRLRHGIGRVPLRGITEDRVDYGAAVPLQLFDPARTAMRAVIIGHSDLSIAAHKNAGMRIGEILHALNRRIAVIASVDLSHTLSDDAAGGFSPDGKKFDEMVVHSVRRHSLKAGLPSKALAQSAKSCGLNTIAMLTGALAERNYTPEILSYEAPFGVGYLTAVFYFR